MTSKQAVVQTSRPTLKVKQYSSSSKSFEYDDMISDAVNECLLSYSWSLSVSDTQGSFSVTLFPGTTAKGTKSVTSGYDLYDSLHTMDVVEIYEAVYNTNSENAYNAKTTAAGTSYIAESYPVFVGVIKRKKYVAQMTDSGVSRRIQISGISAVGLIGQLQLDFNVTTMAVKDTLSANQGVFEGLTVNVTGYTNSSAKEAGENTIKNVVNAVWQVYQNQARALALNNNCQILDMIDALGVTFDFDDSKVEYYLANVFGSESTQNVFDMIHTIAGEPVYETFASFYLTDSDGEERFSPHIKIRMVPFSSGLWQELTHWEIEAIDVKGFDFTQSDEEVYTVFFTYLDGYPVSEQMLMTLSTLLHKNKTDKDALATTVQSSNLVQYDEDKYSIYGYRLLNAKFRGYEKGIGIANPDTMMEEMNQNMKNWFGHLDEMLKGSVSLAMTGPATRIQAGEVLEFLGCEFYIEGVSHSWEVNRGGDVNLSLSRGGKYENGVFSQATDFTDQTRLFEGISSTDSTSGGAS